MEINKILRTKEILSIINERFQLGELYDDNDKIRPLIHRLEERKNLKGSTDKIIDIIFDSLEKIIEDRKIIDIYKKNLKSFLEMDTFKNIPKEIFIYFISSEGLKIYFENKDKEFLIDPFFPFDIMNKKNTFESYIEFFLKSKGLKLRDLVDGNSSNWSNNNGSTISSHGLLSLKESLESESFTKEEIEEILIVLFFKRIQWKAYEKIKKIVDRRVINIFKEIIVVFIEIKDSGEDLSIFEVMDMITKPFYKHFDEKDIKKVIYQINNTINVMKKPSLQNKLSNFILQFENLKNYKGYFKEKTLINKSKEHKGLIEIHKKYNILKNNYSLEGHKKLKKKIEEILIGSNKKEYEKYFKYFIEDSYYLLDSKLEIAEKQVQRNKIESMQLSFYKLSKNRCELNKKFDGSIIDYLTYVLNSFSLINIIEPLEFFIEYAEPEFEIVMKKKIEPTFLEFKEITITTTSNAEGGEI